MFYCMLLCCVAPHRSVFMGVSAPPHPHPSGADPSLELLDKEAVRENGLSAADILGVSRASLQAGSSGGMQAYTNKVTLCHIEVGGFLCCVVFVWCDVVCCVVLCCVVWCGVVWCGVVWCGVVLCCVVLCCVMCGVV
jgi:hypothetical protein